MVKRAPMPRQVCSRGEMEEGQDADSEAPECEGHEVAPLEVPLQEPYGGVGGNERGGIAGERLSSDAVAQRPRRSGIL